MNDLIYLPEPPLLFRYEQPVEDPRDGLTLFGPLDKGSPYGIRAGVVGTKDGIRRFRQWVTKIQHPIIGSDPDEYFQLSHPPFPGFEAAFCIPWNPEPTLELTIDDDELKSVYLNEKHQRVYKTVDVYTNRISGAIGKQDVGIDVWFVIVPDAVLPTSVFRGSATADRGRFPPLTDVGEAVVDGAIAVQGTEYRRRTV